MTASEKQRLFRNTEIPLATTILYNDVILHSIWLKVVDAGKGRDYCPIVVDNAWRPNLIAALGELYGLDRSVIKLRHDLETKRSFDEIRPRPL